MSCPPDGREPDERRPPPRGAQAIEVREESLADLEAYAAVPIAFRVRSVFELTEREGGLGGFRLVERPLDRPFEKDYDELPGNRPVDWPARFDLSHWVLLSARVEGRRAGGAALAFRAPGPAVPAARDDPAVLWDLRVAPAFRRRGVGRALFREAARRALARGCRRLQAETQNVNVPACRFYARQGCVLGAVDRFAYPELPDEIRLLWVKELAADGSRGRARRRR